VGQETWSGVGAGLDRLAGHEEVQTFKGGDVQLVFHVTVSVLLAVPQQL
jgi:hypothetical protein